jgi:hypothetical protein
VNFGRGISFRLDGFIADLA